MRFADLNWLDMPARDRNAGFVFQQYALFKHMTVADNIAFGLKVRPRRKRPSRREIAARVKQLLALVQLAGLGKTAIPANCRAANASAWRWRGHWPSNRACCCWMSRSARWTPRCARSCAPELRHIHDHAGVTSVFVTHDQEEAFAVADLVAVMKDGRIEQYGASADVRRSPRTAFVSEFLSA